MKHKINGYVVVRQADRNYPFHNPNFQTKLPNVPYNGLQRCIWEDIIEDYYDKQLPENLHTAFSGIMKMAYLPDISLTPSLDDAIALLEYSNRQNQWNEIITVYSEVLSQHKGELEIDSRYHKILGYDYLHDSSQSIVFDGIHAYPKGFRKWRKRLNSFGLFHSAKYLEEYHQKFMQLSEEVFLENYGDYEPFYYACRIGRIDTDTYLQDRTF